MPTLVDMVGGDKSAIEDVEVKIWSRFKEQEDERENSSLALSPLWYIARDK